MKRKIIVGLIVLAIVVMAMFLGCVEYMTERQNKLKEVKEVLL